MSRNTFVLLWCTIMVAVGLASYMLVVGTSHDVTEETIRAGALSIVKEIRTLPLIPCADPTFQEEMVSAQEHTQQAATKFEEEALKNPLDLEALATRANEVREELGKSSEIAQKCSGIPLP